MTALAAALTLLVASSSAFAAGPSAQANPEVWPALESPLSKDPALERRVQELLAKMSVEEKV